MSEYLSKYFHVQLCSDNVEMIKGMLSISQPDIVVISLIGMDKGQTGIFSILKYNYALIPCICVGTAVEQEPFEQYFRTHQFQALTRPVSNSDLMELVCQKLKLAIDVKKDEMVDVQKLRSNILIVDDNPIQLRALRSMLQSRYDVTMAVSAAEAMVAIGKRVPDLFFLDYEMPMCDGKMTLEMIRNLEEAKAVPVVFLTGVRDAAHIKAVLDLKPAGYMLKPATQEAIDEMIKKTLGNVNTN